MEGFSAEHCLGGIQVPLFYNQPVWPAARPPAGGRTRRLNAIIDDLSDPHSAGLTHQLCDGADLCISYGLLHHGGEPVHVHIVF